jgi:hypothetical protein
MATERIARTSGADRVGRPVVYSDADVPHQIRIRTDGAGGVVSLIGCSCGAPRARLAWGTSDETMWATWRGLAHAPDLEATG